MKILTNAVALAAVIMSCAFTGAFAEDSAGQPGIRVEESATAPEGPGQRPGSAPPDIARDHAARKERDRAVRDFQKALHDAEREFNASEKAASKLQGEQRRTAMQKAAAEMKATIKKAEQERDAALEKAGYARKKPPQRTESGKKDIDAGQMSGDQERAGQADLQPQTGAVSPPEQQNK